MTRVARFTTSLWLLLLTDVGLTPAAGAATTLVFARGRITCDISYPGEFLPEAVGMTLPMAMNAALELIGPPATPARLSLRLLEPPSFYKRLKAMFRAEVFALQQGNEIALHPGSNPLKLAFRLGHELSHWLASQKNPARPPLWLDEGLAQLAATTAAATCARTLKQTLSRPPPARLAQHLFALEELTRLTDYPQNAHRSAAFYWQTEELVRALRDKLGPEAFAAYLDLLSGPDAPAWDTPLRDRWYFSDWDMNWLAGQIQPEKQKP
ncbi:MAG TPA: hypothetical protein PKU89_08655 [Kiritimatiellia bacterium]|nr:hypothetical protein [Kiritimatiellia bacterium]